MAKDRLDILCENIMNSLMVARDDLQIDFLKNQLDLIYALFPEQKESAIEKELG